MDESYSYDNFMETYAKLTSTTSPFACSLAYPHSRPTMAKNE